MFQSLVKSQGWVRVGEILLAQKEMRKRSLGDTPIANLEEAFRRNFEIGVSIGIGSIPQVIKGHLEEIAGEYKALLTKEREE